MVIEELKQIWNSAVAVASVAIAIMEHRQRRFRARYLKDCDMEFHNLEDMRPRLLFTLIFSYKRSTHAKEKVSHHQRRKTQRNKRKIEFKREIEGYTKRENAEIH